MQPSLALSIVALAAAIGVGILGSPKDDSEILDRVEALQHENSARSDALDQTLERITSRLDDLERKLAEAPRVERAKAQESDALSEEPVAKKGERSTAQDRGGDDVLPIDANADFEALFAQLADPTTSFEKSDALWKKLAAMGKIDDAITRLEERAKLDPANTALQLDLANGYLSKLYSAKSPIDQGVYATKMDACYDHVLELEPENWEARFSKAISYSHWPAITGKPAQAVKQFEQLVKQQETKGDLRPEYATTYSMLGNLYLQQGKTDLAKQMVEKGVSLFPQNGELKKQLESLK